MTNRPTIFDNYTSEELLTLCHDKRAASPLIESLCQRLESAMSLCQELELCDKHGMINNLTVQNVKKKLEQPTEPPLVITCPTCLADIKT